MRGLAFVAALAAASIAGCAQPLPVFDSSVEDTTPLSALDGDQALAVCEEIAAFYAQMDAVRGTEDVCLRVASLALDEEACVANYDRCRAVGVDYLCDAHTIPVDTSVCDAVFVMGLQRAVNLLARVDVPRTAAELCALSTDERAAQTRVSSPDADVQAALDCMLTTRLHARPVIAP